MGVVLGVVRNGISNSFGVAGDFCVGTSYGTLDEQSIATHLFWSCVGVVAWAAPSLWLDCIPKTYLKSLLGSSRVERPWLPCICSKNNYQLDGGANIYSRTYPRIFMAFSLCINIT